jgi:hypothetical protein
MEKDAKHFRRPGAGKDVLQLLAFFEPEDHELHARGGNRLASRMEAVVFLYM